jgi:hypothetical protein
MKIKPEISTVTLKEIVSQDAKTTVPFTENSEAETTVTVKDGVTIIIGGLKQDDREKTVKKIPLIGDIPGIGYFFRNTSDSLTIKELVILLTPHIMSGENTFTDFSEVPPKEGVVATMKRGKILTNKVSSSGQEEALDFLGSKNEETYYNLIIKKINQFAKQNFPSDKKGEVYINFSVDSDGKLIDEPKVINATDSALVPFAVKAIKDASPFPAFPKSMEKEKESFKISLAYEGEVDKH